MALLPALPGHDQPRREGVAVTEDRIEFHLWNWSRWMGVRVVALPPGAPKKASGGMGVSHRSDVDTMTRAADNRCAAAVDAIIDGLSPIERAAIHHFHLEAVFRFPRVGLGAEKAYALARDRIGFELDRRGIP